MNMNDLNNAQLILLVLFVSFVVSIATGITTVTLLEEAPLSIVQPINRIVRETVRVVVPEKVEPQTVTQTVVIKEEDFIIQAVKKNSPNIIKVGYARRKGLTLTPLGSSSIKQEVEFIGPGFVLGTDGFVVLPDSIFDDDRLVVAQMLSGDTLLDVTLLKRDKERGLALVTVKAPPVTVGVQGESLTPIIFIPIIFGNSDKVELGQTAITLGVGDGLLLLLGVISRLDTLEDTTNNILKIYTTTESDSRYSGGPLLNTDGEVVGINIITPRGDRYTVPTKTIQGMISDYKNPKTNQ